MRRAFAALIAFALVAATAGAQGKADYTDPAQLAKLIESGTPAYILVDVRTAEEFADGYIPTAVNIPVDEIGDAPPTADKKALVIVYCRSGRRSAHARSILEGLGYTAVVDFGGIGRWTGPLAGKNE
jgi:phage shock protein E